MPTDLELVRSVAAADHNLAVCAIARADGTVQASVVSAGVIDDPVDGSPSVGLVAAGNSVKLPLLRRHSEATIIFKSGYRWVSVAGPVRLVGPNDGVDLGLDVSATLRAVFVAAGGQHEDWDEFDQAMAAEQRCAVFVRADRITSNPES